jgi:hypothetical protein
MQACCKHNVKSWQKHYEHSVLCAQNRLLGMLSASYETKRGIADHVITNIACSDSHAQ